MIIDDIIKPSGAKINGTKKSYTIASGIEIKSGEFVSLIGGRATKFNGTLLGIALKNGSGGQTIEVMIP